MVTIAFVVWLELLNNQKCHVKILNFIKYATLESLEILVLMDQKLPNRTKLLKRFVWKKYLGSKA